MKWLKSRALEKTVQKETDLEKTSELLRFSEEYQIAIGTGGPI